jgi:hypothetical protein
MGTTPSFIGDKSSIDLGKLKSYLPAESFAKTLPPNPNVPAVKNAVLKNFLLFWLIVFLFIQF